jgi:effector-binding domain-containing protein
MLRFPALLAATTAVLLASGPACFAEPQPAVLGPVIHRTYPASTFFYLPGRTTLTGIQAEMGQAIPRLVKAMAGQGLGVATPIMVVYHGAGPDPDKAFDYEVGVLVPPGTQAAGDGRVRSLAAFPCATLVFTGSFDQMGKAYEALYPAILGEGKTPTAETRQMILYYEKEASPNNMVLVQIGLQ